VVDKCLEETVMTEISAVVWDVQFLPEAIIKDRLATALKARPRYPDATSMKLSRYPMSSRQQPG
jgi:hypothetical protein